MDTHMHGSVYRYALCEGLWQCQSFAKTHVVEQEGAPHSATSNVSALR